MKFTTIVLASFLLAFTVSAQKDLNLEDAVLNQYRKYAPDRVTNFQWIPEGTEYSFLTEKRTQLVKSNIQSDAIEKIISIADVNKILGTEFPVFYSTEWLDTDKLLLSNGESYYTVNIATKTGETIHSLEEGASSPDAKNSAKHN